MGRNAARPVAAGPALQDRAERLGQGRDEPGERAPWPAASGARRGIQAAARRRSDVTECPVLTDIGIRVPDLAWASAAFMRQYAGASPLPRAPEICVEVISPSN